MNSTVGRWTESIGRYNVETMIRLPGGLLLTLSLFYITSASDKPRLLIQRIGPSASAIYIANAHGSGERQIFTRSALDYNAALFPHGEWIVFTSERAGSADLYRARVDLRRIGKAHGQSE